jgi:hypothetical protein
MSIVIELLAQILLEILAYGVGRVFVMVFLPWCRVETSSRHDPDEERRWKWRGFSYVESGRRVLREGTVQLIGVVVIIGLVVMGYSLSR